MIMIIQHNMASMYTNRQLNINSKKLSQNAERLSSGYRINRASDDAAGLAISEKMRGQIKGLNQASRNIQHGISLCQTMDGGMQNITDIIQRQRELIIQGLNDTNTPEDKAIIQTELDRLTKGIDEIANGVEFNGISLLNRSPEIVRTPIIEMVTTTYSVPVYRTELVYTEDVNKNQISAIVKTPPVDVNSNGRFQFFATNNNGDISKLLFGGTATTSSPSIRINETIYEIWNQSGSTSIDNGPPQMWNTTYSINSDGLDLNIIQHVSVVNNPSNIGGQSYCITYEVVNNNLDEAVTFDFMYHADTMLGDNDAAPFRVDGTPIQYETSYEDSDIPTQIEIYDSLTNPYINGIITVKHSSDFPIENEPDKVNLATWQGKDLATGETLATRHYDTGSTSKWISDSEYAVVWTGRTVEAEESYSMTTYYGVKNPESANVTVFHPPVEIQVLDHYEEHEEISEEIVGWQEERNDIFINIQAGANTYQSIQINLYDCRAKSMGVNNIVTDPLEEANQSLVALDNALAYLNGYRSNQGAQYNRLEHTLSNVNNMAENLTASESKIRDADMASEMVEFTKNQILMQAAQSMLSQTNSSPDSILKLLQ